MEVLVWQVTCLTCRGQVVADDPYAIRLFTAKHRMGGAGRGVLCRASTHDVEADLFPSGYEPVLIGFQGYLDDWLPDEERAEEQSKMANSWFNAASPQDQGSTAIQPGGD